MFTMNTSRRLSLPALLLLIGVLGCDLSLSEQLPKHGSGPIASNSATNEDNPPEATSNTTYSEKTLRDIFLSYYRNRYINSRDGKLFKIIDEPIIVIRKTNTLTYPYELDLDVPAERGPNNPEPILIQRRFWFSVQDHKFHPCYKPRVNGDWELQSAEAQRKYFDIE